MGAGCGLERVVVELHRLSAGLGRRRNRYRDRFYGDRIRQSGLCGAVLPVVHLPGEQFGFGGKAELRRDRVLHR